MRRGWTPSRRGGGASSGPRRPRVFFEEWDEPHISGIRWVSELLGIAGGDDCFPNWRCSRWARTASLPTAPRSCGAPGHRHRLLVRQEVPAREGGGAPGLAGRAGGEDRQLFEIKSADILQPGPAALTDGVEQMHRIVMDWMVAHG
jgi:iron complex transport system substrate-binding protein